MRGYFIHLPQLPIHLLKEQIMSALGTKHNCSHCGTRFYDLNKDPAVCPKCGTIAQLQASPSFLMHQEELRKEEIYARRQTMHRFKDDDMELGSTYDALEELEDEEVELGSFSELDERERPNMMLGQDDDVHEDTLMDELDNDVLLDDAREAGMRN
ncbi:MAG: TIGR02300 family protein [Alphaproteobacteria bacterium]|nr:MAG: TIGR02300 family protein [Alphaproteobacteria bacterium]